MIEQENTCRKYGAEFVACAPDEKLGIARNVRDGVRPVNGLRLQPAHGTCGWYLWAGERLSDDPDFFVPLHVAHVKDLCAPIVRFLGLPPGWRFLFDGEYEDVWQDSSLLEQGPENND